MKSDRRSATACERRAQAFELRKIGYTFREIGAQLGITGQGAHGIVRRELLRLNRQTEGDADVLREQELARLDSLTKACWEKAMAGDPQMIDKLLRISERRSKFLGLDSPLKTSIDIPYDAVHVYLPNNGRDIQPTGENDDESN